MYIFLGLVLLFILFLFRILLRSQWAAAALFVLLLASFTGLGDESFLVGIINALIGIAYVFVLMRFGLLAVVAELFFEDLLLNFPITPHLSAWYAGIGLTGLGLLFALTLFAFHTSLGGQPLFGRTSLED